jgi:hypothetical protein
MPTGIKYLSIKLYTFRCGSPWYGRVSVVSEMLRRKIRGIKEFYPFWGCFDARCIWTNGKYTDKHPPTSTGLSSPDEGIGQKVRSGPKVPSLS